MHNDILKIRAHHLLCMQGFQGYGYSDKFVEHMGEVVKYIKDNAQDEIMIVDYCDNICLACKNNINDVCTNYKNVNNMDKKLLHKLKLKGEQVVKVGAVLSLVKEEFQSLQDAYEICGECSWSEKCLWISKFR
mgnify:CR=1 FL=1